MKSDSVCTTVLPDRLIEKLSTLKLSETQYDKAVRIISLILRNKRREKLLREDFVAIPSTYWIKAVGKRYDRVMRILLDSGIVRDTRYSWYSSTCKSYQINPALMIGSISRVEFMGSRETPDRSPECRSTVRFMRSLRLDVRKAKAETELYISSGAYKKDIIIDPDIPEKDSIGVHPRNTGYGEMRHFTVATWKHIAKSKGLQLILDDGDFYIDDPDSYFSEKEWNIRMSYMDTIYRFQSREFYAGRNTTNHRLDSNLSSFPSMLLKCLNYKGEPLASIDLSNSQFVMFARIAESGFFHYYLDFPLPISHKSDSGDSICTYNTTRSSRKLVEVEVENPIMTEDMMEFIKVAKSGKLYEYIQKFLGLPEGDSGRRMAKQLMFGICFSKRSDKRSSKRVLRSVFPVVVEVMDQVKVKFKDNSIAILLQLMESKIFIDMIKTELDKRGYDTATKHDSVLCPISQRPGVEATIREILDRELEQYQLKIEVLE